MPSKTFTFSQGWDQWQVPAKVKSVTVEAHGGGSAGRRGGRVMGTLQVKAGQSLWIRIGGEGQPGSGRSGGAGGWGGGGDGGSGSNAGGGASGGGGATVVRLNSKTGTIKLVAAGAGGSSSDGGLGGRGGGSVGENGLPGAGDPDKAGNATGGTPIQGGTGGTSIVGSAWSGADAKDTSLSSGGRGGDGEVGGGGGGGGFRGGGGGQAASPDSPSGGGGGGSNYLAGVTKTQNERAGGSLTDGRVILTWINPEAAEQPPTSVSDLKINGRPESPGLATKARNSVALSAKIQDPDKSKVRLLVHLSASSSFGGKTIFRSDWTKSGSRAEVKLTNLAQNTRYYVRVWSEDPKGNTSLNYNSANFWTNRKPSAPKLQTPSTGAPIDEIEAITFEWNHRDPDPNDSQTAFQHRVREIVVDGPPSQWLTYERATSAETLVLNPGSLSPNEFYEWQVRTRDQFSWGDWATPSTFYVVGAARAPKILSPAQSAAVTVDQPTVFTWRFRDPDDSATQIRADLRYRVVGVNTWTVITGDTDVPGSDMSWEIPEWTFEANVPTEFQIRTYDDIGGLPSPWSTVERFLGVRSPGWKLTSGLVNAQAGELGSGVNRLLIFDRGGEVYRGEISGFETLTYTRLRDDISGLNARIVDMHRNRDLIRAIHTWSHEAVVVRTANGVTKRVWEGPITKIEFANDSVVIEARDPMIYLYRRILRQGYNDAHRVVNGEVYGLNTVVQRAALNIINALAHDDPNLLGYLTTLDYPDDAKESRSIPAYSRTVWEDVDDMAAKAGLDYTTIGRRIMLWDTHRAIGRLPELRGQLFSSEPVFTEYGMQLATYFAVTNGFGVWGAASADDSYTGPVEMLASAFGDTDAGTIVDLTPAATEALRQVFTEQARRNITNRNPTPRLIRVPENTALLPSTPIDINSLIPGVWAPVRASTQLFSMAQWMKLDTVTVSQVRDAETVQVSLSQAPNRGQDPDSDFSEEV